MGHPCSHKKEWGRVQWVVQCHFQAILLSDKKQGEKSKYCMLPFMLTKKENWVYTHWLLFAQKTQEVQVPDYVVPLKLM